MNLVIHQFKKDFVRTRVILAIWFLAVVLQFALVGWGAKPGDVVMQSFYPILSTMLAFFNSILILVLVPILIHQEPLVGTTAFWFTRPLSRPTLLASKSLFALILLALPLLTQSLVLLANGVTPHDVALAAPQVLLSQFSWVLVVAILAVLTPNFSRFAIVGVVILIIWYVGLFIVQMTLMLQDPWAFAATAPTLTSSRTVVSSLVTLGLGCAVILLQYLVRRWTLAVTLAISAAAASLLVQYLWPWDFLKTPPQLAEDSTFKADTVTASLTAPVYVSDQPSLRGGVPLKQIRASFNYDGCPKGYIVKTKVNDPVLLTADGQKIASQPMSDAFNYSNGNDPDAIELALGNIPVLNLSAYSITQAGLLAVEADIYSRYASTPVHLTAELDCTAYKYVVVTELPLKKGARYDQGSEHLVVTDVLSHENGVDITLRERNVKLLLDPKASDQNAIYPGTGQTVYLLVNRKRQQAIAQKPDMSFNFNYGFDSNSILTNNPLRCSFGPDENNRQNWLLPDFDKAWLADTVLVRLDLVPVATFTRTLDVPGFRLDGKFRAPGSPSYGRVADLDELNQIVLPHDATREQVIDYINAILTASRRQMRWDEHDPQVDMLEQVGAENVDLLIQSARDNHNYYLNHAINALAQPDHKDMVIAALATNSDLIDTVIDHGWQNDAKPELMALLADTTRTLPRKVLFAIAAFKDPATYDGLKDAYINQPGDDLLDVLKTLPGFDTAGTVDLAWKKTQSNWQQAWQTPRLLAAAAQFNEPGVIDIAFKMLKSDRDTYGRALAGKMFRNYTPATGKTDEELIKWLEANRSKLVFDQQTGKFVLGPLGVPSPSSTPVPPPAPTPAPPVKSGT